MRGTSPVPEEIRSLDFPAGCDSDVQLTRCGAEAKYSARCRSCGRIWMLCADHLRYLMGLNTTACSGCGMHGLLRVSFDVRDFS